MDHPSSDRLIRACNDYMRNSILAMSCLEYQKKIIQLKVEDGEYIRVKASKNWLRYICRHNNIDLINFLNSVISVVNMSEQKRNTLYLQGPSYAGKSKVLWSIANGFMNVDQTTRSDTFLFQDLPGSQICVIEE